MFAHVTNGTVDQIGNPPATAFADGRWWDLRTLDPGALTATGWLPVDETARPADTATTTSDMSWTITNGRAVQTWTVRPKTAAELDGDAAATNSANLRDKARTAITANNTYLALVSPTNAQVVAQVNRLTRENTALIRLTINALDSTDGT